MNVVIEETFLDYPSPDNSAIIIFLPGCEHQCKGCHNSELQKLHDAWKQKEENEIILKLKTMCQRCETNKIVLSGGDPLNPCNRNLTIHICEFLGKNIKDKYDICIYTGYEIEEVKKMNLSGFKYIKCGKFDYTNIQLAEKTDSYIQFVNPTQNLYDSNYQQLSYAGRFNF